MKVTGATVSGVSLGVALGLLTLVAEGAGLHQTGSNGMRESPARQSGQDPAYSKSGHDITPLARDRIGELARNLTPEERHILLDKGTERAFCGALLESTGTGVYTCRLCGLPLFDSDSKFASGTGWPSFFDPADPGHIRNQRDDSHGMIRTEIQCARCGSHLGHVFEDGPPPTGLRYCVNSAALRFYGEDEKLPDESRPVQTSTAYFAAGCFWGVEDRFQNVPGVVDAVSGYMGGTTPDPTYRQVCSGTTGHAETVRVAYDSRRTTYEKLLEMFFKFHDPGQLNRQGPDIGTQYRSAVFAVDDEQLEQARACIAELRQSSALRGRDIVTRVERAGPFYEAEEYHQDYHAKHGGSCALPGD